MARIRTIKPEFFRHEALQDLEIANPGMYPMMVFEGLWGHCDSKGRFEWKPRMLKLDILPFLPFDMAETMAILEKAGMLHRYTVDGKEYGFIDTFEKHQRLSGKELTEGEKFPSPVREVTGKHQGSDGEIPESQEGKGREEEGKRNGVPTLPASPASTPTDDEQAADETETELQAACRETWKAYAEAFFDRYGTGPVRNRTVNSQVKAFVQRLGRAESPHVAAFFVRHPQAFYVKAKHQFGLALKDAEGLRTEWATNRIVTDTQARQSDRTGANMNAADEAMRILEGEVMQ